jgi:hypothetical protein
VKASLGGIAIGVAPVVQVEIFYELAMNWQLFKSLVQGVHVSVGGNLE